MLQTSARLLRLLSLFQAQRYWSGAELSRRLDVTARTLRRDVDRLRSLGYPVHSTAGVAGGYQLGAGANLPPLLLDDDEAVAVALGLRTAASGTVSGMEESSVRALLKLEQVLPPRLRNRVAALHGSIVHLGSRGTVVDADRLSAIAGACRDHEKIRFRYNDRAGSCQRATDRAAQTGAYRLSLVSGGVGCRPGRLAHLPRRSHRWQDQDLDPVQAPQGRRKEISSPSSRNRSRRCPIPAGHR